jgi:hypothetical protein
MTGITGSAKGQICHLALSPVKLNCSNTLISVVVGKVLNDQTMEEFQQLVTNHGYRDTCNWAAENGRLDVLQWAREGGCSWNVYVCAFAAMGGHLHILQWLRKHGCPWNELTCVYAARGGHLYILQWAREHGCPWNEFTCAHAAYGGHLQLLQWALENKCPIDPYTIVGFKNRHFTSASKLLHRNIFENQDNVKEWIEIVDETCNTLTYNDLSRLIKSFI